MSEGQVKNEPSTSESKDKPAAKKKAPDKVALLEQRVDNLTLAFEKLATYTGNSNFLEAFGLKRYEPSKDEMKKKRG